MRTRFAVLLTEAAYSCRDNYHLILPLMRGDGQNAGEELLRIPHGNWVTLFPSPTRSVLLPIPVIQSVWYPSAIERETEYVLDEESLAEIDRRLCAYFSLPYDTPAE